MVCITFCFKNIYQRSYPLCLAGKAVVPTVKYLQEDPLCPLVIAGVAGSYFPIPIVAKANFIELAPKGGDVFFGS